jgi:polyphosphate kinase 2 (PPK2 family)
VDLSKRLDPAEYKGELDAVQAALRKLAWEAYAGKRTAVALFEGWDAAGKGGTIRRLTRAVDVRISKVIPVAAPSDEERAHHYLWRFWRSLPRSGIMAIFDRSWYGRVLVERVEGLATVDEWRRSYREINEFEQQLHESGILLCKFWLHLDAEEQLRRFREREVTPWKRHKLTDEDWRNREKRGAYEAAVNEMVSRTSTEYAPWHLIAANDKKHARVKVLTTICERLEEALGAS